MKDVDDVADLVLKTGILPDLIMSSPAVRTQQSALILASKFSYPEVEIVYEKFLYENFKKWDVLLLLQNSFPDKDTVFIVGHNPLIAYFADELTGKFNEFPAGKALGISFICNDWQLNQGEIIFSFEP